MAKKAYITVEKFAQGITIRCNKENAPLTKALATLGTECSIIGKEAWDNVNEIFNKSLTDMVRIKLEYEAL